MTQQTVSSEVKEIFQDPDFEGLLKKLASEFGKDATLESINFWFQQNRPVPEKLINGKRFFAGYRGAKMVSEGNHSGKLIDITQNGSNCKLMFSIDGNNTFLYHNFPKEGLKVEQIVRLAGEINEIFPVTVKHDVIPQTGDKHAIVSEVQGLREILEVKN